MWRLAVLAAVGCNAAPAPVEEPPRALGLNDVSFLLPLPEDPAAPVIATVEGLVRENLVASIVFANNIAPKNGAAVAYRDFQIVAVRVDACARDQIGACPPSTDGRLRLVLQPLFLRNGETFAHDIALHAFYAIPAADMPAVVDELRALAALQDVPVTAPLGVNTGVADPAYRERLRALVLAYAGAEQLLKVTVIGQDALSAAFAWRMGGFELRDGAFHTIAIPRLDGRTQQHVLVAGGSVYHVRPSRDTPPGFSLALNPGVFATVTPDEQRFVLEALAGIQNPNKHDAVDVQCAACHVATFLERALATAANIDPATLTERYVSPTFDLTIDNINLRDPRSVRAFGWAGNLPAISQRVANDTAHAIGDLELVSATTNP
ncbi:MAG: hypothetical protein KF773_03120 [Deltaproteobacteria bacterium]|nr:hypothetical protein [Deltaproteobacteria bacterium]MCW5804745.1 hypothetical protein [Deltaproteobacteria bacterium]